MELTKNGNPLAGERVAFTGRLACMTRAEAAELVARHGGEFVASVGPGTSLLVVGQDGWPLRKDGKVTSKLQRARSVTRAGHSLTIIPEVELLARVGLVERSRAICRLYTTAQLTEVVGVSGQHIRGWVQRGWIEPVKTVDGVSFFDFHQASGARALCRLERGGVSAERIGRSLRQIHRWLPALDKPLTQLGGLEHGGRLLVRLGEGRLADPSGQLWFDFEDASEPGANTLKSASPSADSYFEQGHAHEEAGRLSEAAEAYRDALHVGGPDADTCFNLANVLHRLGQTRQAVECYRQAVVTNAGHAEAWNNLGAALEELHETEQAIQAYRQALQADPRSADAHFNLADALTQLGRPKDAAPHWRAYLRYDRTSRWAAYARSALSAETGS